MPAGRAGAVVLFLNFGGPRCSGFLIDGFSWRCTFTVQEVLWSDQESSGVIGSRRESTVEVIQCHVTVNGQTVWARCSYTVVLIGN